MSALAVLSFNFEGTELRGFEQEGKPWFIAQDACALLGYTNTSLAVAKLDDDEKGISNRYTLGGQQQMLTISESGLWCLVIRSRRPEAQRIRRWVTEEVLPTIRRTGQYQLPVIDDAENDDEPEGSPALPLGSPDEVERLRVKIALVREARHAYGPRSARGLWEAIGLPDVERIEGPRGLLTLDDVNEGVSDWLTARCSMDATCRTESLALYKDYRRWCDERDLMPLGHVGFAKQLNRMRIRSIKSNRTWRIGIRLKD